MKKTIEKTITEEKWSETYSPIINQEGTEKTIMACAANHDEMVATAKDLAEKDGTGADWIQFVWTTVDGDDGEVILVSGPAFVNRIDWYFTEKPWTDGEIVFVPFEVAV